MRSDESDEQACEICGHYEPIFNDGLCQDCSIDKANSERNPECKVCGCPCDCHSEDSITLCSNCNCGQTCMVRTDGN
jgi:hypothetical protein